MRGRSEDSLISSFTSLIPLFEAASISTTSGKDELSILLHELQLLHGSIVFLFLQFTDFAKMRAVDVLPVPFCPIKRNARGIDLLVRIDVMVSLGAVLSSSEIVRGL